MENTSLLHHRRMMVSHEALIYCFMTSLITFASCLVCIHVFVYIE